MIAPHFSGGVSYFTGKANADTTVCYATTWTTIIGPWVVRLIDYFSMPASAEVEIGQIGFNLGGGVDILIHRNFALVLAARYFYAKELEAPWEISPGDYDAMIDELDFGWYITFDQADADAIAEEIASFLFNPSFFSIIFAIKVMF